MEGHPGKSSGVAGSISVPTGTRGGFVDAIHIVSIRTKDRVKQVTVPNWVEVPHGPWWWRTYTWELKSGWVDVYPTK